MHSYGDVVNFNQILEELDRFTLICNFSERTYFLEINELQMHLCSPANDCKIVQLNVIKNTHVSFKI